MKRALATLIFAVTGCATTQSGLQIDDRYYASWSRELEVASTKLVLAGYARLPDDFDLAVVTLVGERFEDGMWKRWLEVPVSSNPEGGLWVGGNAVPGKITLVCDPSGNIKPGVMEHEAAHQILWSNRINDTKHHAIMKQAGVWGR